MYNRIYVIRWSVDGSKSAATSLAHACRISLRPHTHWMATGIYWCNVLSNSAWPGLRV